MPNESPQVAFMAPSHSQLGSSKALRESPSAVSDPGMMKPVFIGGCGRSGTTMLGAMLGTHPDCLATPESKFIHSARRSCTSNTGEIDARAALEHITAHWNFKIWDVDVDTAKVLDESIRYTFTDVITWLVQQYGIKVGKPQPHIWVDHTPNSVRHAATLFELFPNAKMIHLVRDGRANAASVMKLDWGPNTIAAAANWWVTKVTHGLVAESLFGQSRVKRIRYETLVRKPEETLRQICTFLGIEYRQEMVTSTGFQTPWYTSAQHSLVGSAPQQERLDAWRKELRPRQIEIFESIAAHFLRALGYDPLIEVGARHITRWERIWYASEEVIRRRIVNRMWHRRRVRQSLSPAALGIQRKS